MALQAFSVAIAPLPGVAVPPGGADPSMDATMASWWLESVRDSITPEQRAAADAAIARYPQPFAQVSGSVDRQAGSVMTEAAAAANCTIFPSSTPVASTPALAERFRFWVVKASEHLGHAPPRYAICLVPGTTGGGLTVLRDIQSQPLGKLESCVLTVGANGLDDSFLAGMALYCIFNMAFPDLKSFSDAAKPPWLYMGMGKWAKMTMLYEHSVPANESDLQQWRDYLTTPTTSTLTRGADAIGFWSQVDKAMSGAATGVLWTKVFEFLRADSTAAFGLATGTNGRFQEIWSAGYFRKNGEWDMTGPGITSDIHPVDSVRIGNSSLTFEHAPLYATRQLNVNAVADVIHFDTQGQTIRFTDGATDVVIARPSVAYYCTRDGGRTDCTCPKGTTPLVRGITKLGPSIDVAIDGTRNGETQIEGLSMADFCKPAPASCELPPGIGLGPVTIELAATAAASPAPAPLAIPAGTYEGTVVYTAIGPNFSHDGSGKIRFTVDSDRKVKGTWDLKYTVTIRSAFSGTGTIAAGIFAGTGADLHLTGTNVVNTGHSTLSVPFPDLPLAVSATCDSRVVIRWERNENGYLQQITIDAHPAGTP